MPGARGRIDVCPPIFLNDFLKMFGDFGGFLSIVDGILIEFEG